jgi:hypothetical protein
LTQSLTDVVFTGTGNVTLAKTASR